MRLARRTYKGAFHHAMNRGYEGRILFQCSSDRKFFMDLMKKNLDVTKIRLLAYCLMDNHYHMILQNTTGNMSKFFKDLNSQYALYFRKKYGGRGYVFQDRYKSMLIQDDVYLQVAIAYVLNNPVRAERCMSFTDYPWSSGSYYFSGKGKEPDTIDTRYLEELFGDRTAFIEFVQTFAKKDLPTKKTDLGWIIGGENLPSGLRQKAERRSGKESLERRRDDDSYFEPLAKVIQEFQRSYHVNLNNLDMGTYAHKKIRTQLLVHLKDRTGLSYREIAQLDWFSDVSHNSLGTLYQRGKRRMEKERRQK